MNFQFLKLSHIQRIDAPRLNDADIDMDSYTRFVPFGHATTCSEERISNISNMRRCNIASQWGGSGWYPFSPCCFTYPYSLHVCLHSPCIPVNMMKR